MTDFSDPSGASLRLSDDERERAVGALQAHAAQGRLTDAELASRSSAARAAVTRGDLAPLFSDLPGPLELDGGAPATGSVRRPMAAQQSAAGYADEDTSRRRPERWGYVVVSIVPFVALILFFVTGMAWGYQYSWLWFLLIPIVGAIAYGADGGRRR
ncbi:DUF1707 domain-containing protein [uncultured Leifsonia sp.]|uniref:DUF1707 SHOCT-like domain-containing protein n=1 Tax=uncultured Leifsonia sp. TaxID=340359 RepID=UPI0028D2F943|nr:DUF1707 domain-containing protein [uncultured Leifsonia sp.]